MGLNSQPGKSCRSCYPVKTGIMMPIVPLSSAWTSTVWWPISMADCGRSRRSGWASSSRRCRSECRGDSRSGASIEAPGGYEALHKFAVMQRELFLKLPPTARSPQTLRRLSKEGVRIRIITHRLFIKYFHQVAVTQTIQWLDYHDIPYWDLCFMQQKTAVGADLYIEDSPANVERLRAEGQKTIVFSNSTNENLPPPRAHSWEEVLPLVMAEKLAWEAKGQ